MTMPFDVCERFIDRLLGMFPSITREQAKQYVASVDEAITITEAKAEERIISIIEQKLQPKIRLEVKESDIATGKDILILDNKIDSIKSELKNDIALVSKDITVIKWLLGIIITLSGVIATFMTLNN